MGNRAVVGAVVVLVGIVATALSIFALDWVEARGQGATFSDLNDFLDAAGDRAPDFSAMYFSWLALVLLIVGGLAALAGRMNTAMGQVLRVVGLVLGIAGVAATLYARKGDGEWGDIFDDSAIGLYFALGGFALIGIGSVLPSD